LRDIIAAVNIGLSLSVDGGTTWTQVIVRDVTDVAIDPADSLLIYAAQRGVGIVKIQ
jgi:hypothetical protein